VEEGSSTNFLTALRCSLNGRKKCSGNSDLPFGVLSHVPVTYTLETPSWNIFSLYKSHRILFVELSNCSKRLSRHSEIF
jgi:hypothetical protein